LPIIFKKQSHNKGSISTYTASNWA